MIVHTNIFYFLILFEELESSLGIFFLGEKIETVLGVFDQILDWAVKSERAIYSIQTNDEI